MATRGTAAKSASGASMSKYDVEVEARLQALEAEAHKKPTGATAAKVEESLCDCLCNFCNWYVLS